MLISVHLPKTAGSSFLEALESHFGDHMLRDYADLPMNRSTFRRNVSALQRAVMLSGRDRVNARIDCIHGHYMPIKYRLLRSATPKSYVTWMRDPVERLASHYYYWRRSYEAETAARVHSLVVEEDWSLERFCFSREMRNTYTKFLWGFPLAKFHFIGITEDFDNEIRRFSTQILGGELPVPSVNRNPGAAMGPYIEDPEFRAAIESYHAKDMGLYRQALALRDRQHPLRGAI